MMLKLKLASKFGTVRNKYSSQLLKISANYLSIILQKKTVKPTNLPNVLSSVKSIMIVIRGGHAPENTVAEPYGLISLLMKKR